MALRAAVDYADFLLPCVGKATHLLDVGSGDGALSAGLAARCGRVTAIDTSADDLAGASAAARGIPNLRFVQAAAEQLPFLGSTFDAVLAHSVLEAVTDPAQTLREAGRVLRPDGWLGVASVEYCGLILAGPQVDLLRRSNAIRERIWLRSGANPFLGRELRRLVGEAGFVDVEATTKAFSYGTPARVQDFARGRASECADAEHRAEAVEAGLATEEEMAEMTAAWSSWGESSAAYAAFTWCRVVARRPAS